MNSFSFFRALCSTIISMIEKLVYINKLKETKVKIKLKKKI